MIEYIVRKYDNGAQEIICNDSRVVIYNNKDTVYFKGSDVVGIHTHDGIKIGEFFEELRAIDIKGEVK